MKNIITVFLIFTLFSCSKEVKPDVKGLEGGIWIYQSHSGGIAGFTYTREKDGCTEIDIIEINSDADFKIKYCSDESILGNISFFEEDGIEKINFKEANRSFFYSVSNDSLILDDGCCDRFSYVFIRD